MAWPVVSKRYAPCTDHPRTGKTMPVDILGRLLLWLERRRRRRHLGRHQRRHLGQLSNHMLKDIGLARIDIESAMGRLPWQE